MFADVDGAIVEEREYRMIRGKPQIRAVKNVQCRVCDYCRPISKPMNLLANVQDALFRIASAFALYSIDVAGLVIE